MPSTKHYDLDIDATLGGNNASDNVISSQKAVKSYVDSSLAPYQLISPTVNVLATSGTVVLTDNSINSITPAGAVTFTLPTVTDNTVFHQILVQLKLTNTSYISSSAIDNGALGTTDYFNKTKPDLSTTGNYDLVYEYNSIEQVWECGAISKGAAS